MIHCRRGSVCLVILMCYISLSAVVYERFRRAKQYLKQHYQNIKRDSHLSLHQRIVWNKADLPSVQPVLILSVSHTANQESTWRQITNDELVCFWLHLLLDFWTVAYIILCPCWCSFANTLMRISVCLLCVFNFPKLGFLKYVLYIC